MRKILLLLCITLLLGSKAFAQSGQGGSNVIGSVGAPTGTCGALQLDVDTTTGNLYSCDVGTWVAVTGGGGGSGTVTSVIIAGTTNQITATGTCTITTSGTCTLSLPSAVDLTALSASGQITSTVSTGTAPFVVASTTNVANLNASSLGGATFAAPGSIGSGTAGSGAFTTLSASSTVSGTGFSTYLASPPAIGGTAPAAGTFTTLTPTSIAGGALTAALTGTGAYIPVTLLNSGTGASSSTFWRGDGTWATPSGSSGLSGMTAGQVPIAATASTVTSSEALAGSGAAIVTGPATSTSGDVVEYTGTSGQTADSGTLLSALATYPGAGIAVSTGSAWGTSKASPTGTIVGTTDTQTLGAKTFTNTTVDQNYPVAPQFSTTDTLTNASLTSEQFFATISTIPANAIYAGKILRVWVGADVTITATASWKFQAKLCSVSGCGSGTVIPIYVNAVSTLSNALTGVSGGFSMIIQGEAAAGASTAVATSVMVNPDASITNGPFSHNTLTTTQTGVPTNGILYLCFSITYGSTTGTSSMTLTQLVTEWLN